VIFHKINDFLCLWYQRSKRLPKLDRYTIGQKVFELLLEIVLLIVHAEYQSGDRKCYTLKTIAPKLDSIKILIRLARQIETIDEKTYIRYESELQTIGRMLGGWIRSLTKNR